MSTEPAVRQDPQITGELVIPTHIGVTMDGNGRWAQSRGLPRTEGHRHGIAALRRLVECCIRYGVKYLTVYSFSSENWRRPQTEIDFIFKLLHRYVETDLQDLNRNNVRVRILGAREGLAPGLLKTIEHVERTTADNSGLQLNVAFNYGGKAEIVSALRAIAEKVRDGLMSPDQVTEESVESHLYTAGMPEPDLLIRTGGDQRVSNFLLWQAAYAEFVFLPTFWPDFTEEDFVAALTAFSGRSRRFGGIEESK